MIVIDRGDPTQLRLISSDGIELGHRVRRKVQRRGFQVLAQMLDRRGPASEQIRAVETEFNLEMLSKSTAER